MRLTSFFLAFLSPKRRPTHIFVWMRYKSLEGYSITSKNPILCHFFLCLSVFFKIKNKNAVYLITYNRNLDIYSRTCQLTMDVGGLKIVRVKLLLIQNSKYSIFNVAKSDSTIISVME